MQQRAGLLFLAIETKKILLILDEQYWSVPTFERKKTLFDDAQSLFTNYSTGKILPIELYTSEDRGFEYGTYVCVVKDEFKVKDNVTYAWCKMNSIPKNLHSGLKYTLNNQITKTKIETIMELENVNKQ
jgi:hypothetical protein